MDKLTFPSGTVINNDNPLPNLEEEFYVYYKWKLKNNHGYVAGDQVTFNLPKELKVLATDTGNLTDATKTIFATYQIALDGTVTFTFTDVVTSLSNISGDFWMESKLEKSEVEVEDGKVIIGPMEDGGHLEIPVSVDGLKASISKKGEPLPAFSPKEIKWTIVVDSAQYKHTKGVVKDLLPMGLTYQLGTLMINGVKADDPKVEDQELTIDLGDFTGKKTITFITKIDEIAWSKASFTNEATYKSDNSDEVSAKDSIAINRGKPLRKKKGKYNPKTQVIDWEVEINYDSRDLAVTSLKDTWDEGIMALVEDSVKFYEVSIDGIGKAIIGNEATINSGPITSNSSGFTVGLRAINQPYIMKYQTKLTDRVINDGQITNKVEWGGEHSEGNVTTAQAVVRKGHAQPNYKDKTIKWDIQINTDEKQMNNVRVYDFFEPGLELVEDTFTVRVSDQKLKLGIDYKLNILQDNKGFEVELMGDYAVLEKALFISYTTKFDYTKITPPTKLPKFINKAKVTWVTDGNTTTWEKEVEDGFIPDDFTQHDGNKSGYYDARDKTITWRIIANYRQTAHQKLIIRDEIIGNQKLLPDTIKVYEGKMSGSSNSITNGDEVVSANVTKPTINGKPGFEINLGETDKAYIVEYKTTLEELAYIERQYKNTAVILDGTKEVVKLPAEVGINHGGKYATKTGVQNGKVVDWAVKINESQSTIHNAVLTDTISPNQEFIEESVSVYTTKVDNFGNLQKDAVYENVQISIHNQQLSVKFNEKIDRAYVIEYSTIFLAKNREEVTNDYKITGNSINNEGQHDGKEIVTIKQTSGGSASGEIGYLTVKKVDENDETLVLADVEFQLLDKETGRILKSAKTNATGEIDFGRLMYGNYLLREVKAPVGYVMLDKDLEVTINEPYKPTETPAQLGNQLVVKNAKEVKAAVIKKYEPGLMTGLSGAVFTLKDDRGEKLQDGLTTDSDGLIRLPDLDEGTYFLEETAAPSGYNKLTESIQFIIKGGQTKAVEVLVPNVKLGDVLLIKKDKVTGHVLEGVEFELQKKNTTTNTFEKIGTYTTDAAGAIAVKDLEDGNYQFVETKPLIGYKPLDKPILFDLPQKKKAHVELLVENELDESKQTVVKVDEDNHKKLLEGAQFELYKVENGERTLIPNGEKTYFETNAKGEITFRSLTDGSYSFKEIKSPYGYELNTTEFGFIVGDGVADPIQVTNKLKLVSINLSKKDSIDGKSLTGAKFTLTNTDGSVTISNLNTDGQGQLIIDNVPEGVYTLTETARPEGYQTLPKPIVIEVTQNSPAIIEIEVPNAPLGHAQIMKVETGSIFPIAGVTFKLEREIVPGQWEFIEEITTGDRGFAFSDKLDLGNYRYVEVKAPEGVIIDNNPIELVVDATHFAKEELSFIAENSYRQPIIELEKVSDNGQKLSGAQFELYKVERTGEDTLILNEGKTYFETNKAGKIIVEVEPGEYYFIV